MKKDDYWAEKETCGNPLCGLEVATANLYTCGVCGKSGCGQCSTTIFVKHRDGKKEMRVHYQDRCSTPDSNAPKSRGVVFAF